MSDFNQKIICLLTDFGVRGQHYVASMKGVILKINSTIKIIDLSHQVTPYSIIETSFILRATYKYFPRGTVFIIVVDPGVGSPREILALQTNSNYYFIGPNNGIFSSFFADQIIECVEIQNDKYFIKPTSNTFHGRDIMAPIGAYLLSGIPLDNFGPKFNLNDLKESSAVYKIDIEKKIIRCSIQYVDSFGNGITNVQIENNKIMNTELKVPEGANIKLHIRGKTYEGNYTSQFSDVSPNTLLFLVGSTGFLEISINQGNASKTLAFDSGEIITIKL
ncbi:MAG: S-adenosyl-l-methionine hydroxide adenosyltransferase family protein [Promethearchaeota archaeon]